MDAVDTGYRIRSGDKYTGYSGYWIRDTKVRQVYWIQWIRDTGYEVETGNG